MNQIGNTVTDRNLDGVEVNDMSGILWREMVSQGMARSRTEATRLIKQGSVRLEVTGLTSWLADDPDLDLPGRTKVRCGKHMFRCVARNGAAGFDQLRGLIEIPPTPPESDDGCIHVKYSDVSA